MLRFDSDYMEGCVPQILRRLEEINLQQMTGYGLDEISLSAKEKIRKACGCPEAEVYLLVGGTQVNATVIRAVLRSYEGVLAADTGHISVHEAGAVESGGHKVLTLPHKNGKIGAAQIDEYMKKLIGDESCDHMVQPGMVYISHPTEYGTLYTKAELEEINRACRRWDLPLFLDGARMGYALAADPEVTLEVIAQNCDVFYIGGTKVGALFGEAVVFTRPLAAHFFTTVKQSGALLAKGWLLGVQFDTLFTDGLYMEGARRAISAAMRLKEGLLKKGYPLYIDSPTNQQFVVMEDRQLEELKGKVTWSFWEKTDAEHTVIRFATSWATTDDMVDALLELL